MITFIAALLATAQISLANADSIQIQNSDGQPIAGASVVIGEIATTPFKGLEVVTDMNGEIAMPKSWMGPEVLTITAVGYLPSTILNAPPTSAVYQLHSEDVRSQFEIKGQTSAFENLRKDGKVDFAFVYPALKRRQLAQFDIDTVISPEVDEFKILTEVVAVPSNLTLPKQNENYILPITLEKPNYRTYLSKPGQYRLMATHGQFPLKQVVSDLRGGKSFYEVLNHFRFLGGGQKDVTVNSSLDKQDIPVNQIPFNRSITVTGLPVGANEIMIAFTMVDQAGLYFPADIKRLDPGQPQELFLPGGSSKNYIVNLLMPKSEADKIGGVKTEDSDVMASESRDPFSPLKLLFKNIVNIAAVSKMNPANSGEGGISVAFNEEGTLDPKLLPLIPRPVFAADRLVMQPPASVNGIDQIATYGLLSEIETRKSGKYKIERRYRVWELLHLGWTKEIQLPKLIKSADPAKSYRWEIFYLGRATGYTSPTGTYLLDDVTHVTRNSLDF